MAIVATTGCAGDVGAVPLEVIGGGEEITPLGGASVELFHRDSHCSGTLIAPQWVLTAAHCIGNYAGSATVVARDVDPISGEVARITASAGECFMHPAAYDPDGTCGIRGGTSCVDTASREECFSRDFDYALLQLTEPLVAVPFRNIGPPRPCFDDPSEPGAFRFAFRGQGRDTHADPDGLGPLEAGYRPLIRGIGIRRTFGGVLERRLRVNADEGQLFQIGDSGGTFTIEGDDVHGPVVGSAQVIIGGLGAVRSRTAETAWLWHPDIHSWLWSVLDPARNCVLGSSRPCVWRDGTFWPDSDGDGLPDIRDICPSVPVSILPGGGGHADADFDFIGDDCELPGCEDNCSGDTDGDRVFDGCDNCPTVFNTDQADCNGDGVGDACDDADGDGFVDRGDPRSCPMLDNCPGVFNPAQTNCNAEAEEEVNRRREAAMMEPLPLLGDACDPVPCAETQVRAWEEHTRDATVIRMDEVAFDALVGTTTREGRTNLRFCRCSAASANTPLARRECIVERTDGGEPPVPVPGDGGCTLLDIAAYDASATVERSPWRWTTHRLVDAPPSPPSSCITDADCRASEQCRSGVCRCRVPGLCPRPATPEVVNPELAATYATPTGSFEEDRRTRWLLYEQDVPRWRDTVLVAGERFEAHRVPGVVWTHTPGWVGEASFDAVPGLGAEFRQRASYYWSGGVSAPIVRPPVREPFPCFEPIVPFVGSAEVCPLCPFHTPEPWLVFPALTACFDIRIDRPRLLLGRVMLEPQPGLELSGLELFAEDPGPWVAAAEVGSWLPSAGLRYVKLEEGARMTRLLLEQGGSFVDPQLQCPPQQPCGPATGFGLAAASSPEGAPAPRQGHASVLSATREALWVLGGRALEDGRELRDAWRLDVRSGTWMRLTLPPSYVPGRILAATYSAVDQRLWVLDEREESGERVARLVRVPPEGGGAQLVASWPRRSRNEGFALAADPYGALWVAGWPTSGRVHAVLRLERRTATTWAVSGWDLGVGRLVDGGVRANARGVSVLAQVREGRGPSVEFHATAELRSGPGGESACF